MTIMYSQFPAMKIVPQEALLISHKRKRFQDHPHPQNSSTIILSNAADGLEEDIIEADEYKVGQAVIWREGYN